MRDKPNFVGGFFTCVILAIVIVIGGYAGAYYLLCLEEYDDPFGSGYIRTYPYRWQKKLFAPAAAVDSFVRGDIVEPLCHADNDPFGPP